MSDPKAAASGRMDASRAPLDLPPFELPPIDLATLRRYADASGDHTPIHLDDGAARAAGLPGIIAHGLLVMAYLGRALGAWYPGAELREFATRFIAVTRLGDRLTCAGRVTREMSGADAGGVELELSVSDERGELKLKGTARLVPKPSQTEMSA